MPEQMFQQLQQSATEQPGTCVMCG